MKLHMAIFALAASALATGSAIAEQGFYLGGSVGISRTKIDKGSFDSELSALGIGGISSSTDETDTAFRLRAGYQFNDYIAIEGGYANLGTFKYNVDFRTPIAGNAYEKIKVDGFDISAVGTLPVGQGFSLLGKVGAFFSRTKANATATTALANASDDAKATETNLLTGLGIQYAINRNLTVRAEWERFFKVGNNDSTGEGDIDLYSLGLNYRF